MRDGSPPRALCMTSTGGSTARLSAAQRTNDGAARRHRYDPNSQGRPLPAPPAGAGACIISPCVTSGVVWPACPGGNRRFPWSLAWPPALQCTTVAWLARAIHPHMPAVMQIWTGEAGRTARRFH
ncbi:hypothetical protein BS78_06G259000 [Paspalum vaginatum]|nr:hypothetical protein BS78_06G259000 [Paspalum vaginatum]